METSLVILKPDCMEKRLGGVVLDRFLKAGFDPVGAKMLQLDDALLDTHYAHLADKPFFGEIKTFMRSSPVMILALRGDNVIERVRELLGPTDSTRAAKGTIRGDYGEDVMRNIAHASDGAETAKAELERFFTPGELIA
jgi:nucleoside-diphosphate kinase